MKKWFLTSINDKIQNLYYDLILNKHIDSNLIKATDVKVCNEFEIYSLENICIGSVN